MKYSRFALLALLLACLPSFAMARVPSQSNPGFITPVPTTQPLGNSKPKPTEYINELEGASTTPEGANQEATKKIDQAPHAITVNTDNTVIGKTFSSITVNGDKTVKRRKIQKHLKSYLNRPLVEADIATLEDSLTKLFKEEGFLTAQVQVVPDPALPNTLSVHVATKKVGDLLIKRSADQKAHTWEFIIRRNFNAYVKKGQPFNLNEVKDAVNISNQFNTYRIKKVTYTTNAMEPDQVDITISTSEGNPYQLSPTFDDQGRPYIGMYRAGVNASIKNVTGLGDKLSSSNIFSSGTTATVNNYAIPLNGRGTELQFTYTRNHVDVEPSENGDSDGKTWMTNYTLLQPLNKSRTLTASIGYNYRMNESQIDNVTDSKNKTYFLQGGLIYNGTDRFGKSLARVDGQVGRGMQTGQKFMWRTIVTTNRTVNLPLQNQLIFRGIGQLTSDALPIAQDMQLGGAYNVRGYTEGLILGDRGYFFSLEDQFPIPFLSKASPWLSNRLRGAVFFDVGQTWLMDTNSRYRAGFSNKMKNTFLMSTGFGLRYRVTRFFTGFMDVGFGLVDRDHLEHNAQPTARLHFGIRSDLLPQ